MIDQQTWWYVDLRMRSFIIILVISKSRVTVLPNYHRIAVTVTRIKVPNFLEENGI